MSIAALTDLLSSTMPPELDKHPTRETLSLFLAGALDERRRQQVEAHLLSCEQCADALSTVDDTDHLVVLARRSRKLWAGDDTNVLATDNTLARRNEAEPIPDALVDHPRYILHDCIGVGGMGTVYRATHRMMNRPVAVKVIHSSLVDSEAARNQFQIEVQAAAKLSHPNIVTAYDAESTGDTSFLAMEFAEGRSLADKVTQDGPLAAEEALLLIRQAAYGLRHAHAQGLVHRDVKPSNLLEVPAPDGRAVVKVLDFGLARISRESTFTATGTGSLHGFSRHDQVMLGTRHYIAPEQLGNASQADARADIYSLGCTLHFLVTGQPPFIHQSLLEQFQRDEKPQPPYGWKRAEIPENIAGLLDRMLAADPAARFQNIDEFLEAVDSPTVAERPRPAAAIESRRRLRVYAAVLVVAAIVLSAGAWVAFRPAGNRPDEEDHPPSVTASPTAADVTALIVVPPEDVWYAEYQPIRNRLHELGVRTTTASTQRTVTARHLDDSQSAIAVDGFLSDADASNFDVLVVCGGLWNEPLQIPTVKADLARLFGQQLQSGQYVAAICGGQIVLGELGLLRGVKAARPPDHMVRPHWRAVWVHNAPVVTDGNIITARDDDSALIFTEELNRIFGLSP